MDPEPIAVPETTDPFHPYSVWRDEGGGTAVVPGFHPATPAAPAETETPVLQATAEPGHIIPTLTDAPRLRECLRQMFDPRCTAIAHGEDPLDVLARAIATRAQTEIQAIQTETLRTMQKPGVVQTLLHRKTPNDTGKRRYYRYRRKKNTLTS